MPLDLAINGNGFFQVSNNGAISYSRAGYFGTDREGFIVDNFGYNLQGYTTDANGAVKGWHCYLTYRLKPASQDPKPTSKIEQSFNLNSTNDVPINTPFCCRLILKAITRRLQPIFMIRKVMRMY